MSDVLAVNNDATEKYMRHGPGFVSTVLDSFNAPGAGGSHAGTDARSDLADLIGMEQQVKIYQFNGFSATVVDSFASLARSIRVAWDGTNILQSDDAVGANKAHRHSGFSSTISSSHANPDSSPAGLYWDGTNELQAGTGLTTAHYYLMSGFSATVTSSFSLTPGLTNARGIAWDGSNALCSTGNPKHTQQSGFTTTISDSFTPGYTPGGLGFGLAAAPGGAGKPVQTAAVGSGQLQVLVDWGDDGGFTEAIDDITSVVRFLNISQLRELKSEHIDGKVLSMELNNDTHEFSPPNAAAARAGNLKRGRQVWVRNWYPYDTFTGAVGDLIAHTPDFDSGWTWEEEVSARTFELDGSGAARTKGSAAGNYITVWEFNDHNISLSGNITTNAVGGNPGFTMRHVSKSDYIFLRVIEGTSNNIEMRKVVAGVESVFSPALLGSFNWGAGETHFVAIHLHDNNIRVLIDNSEVLNGDVSASAGIDVATVHGLHCKEASTNARILDFGGYKSQFFGRIDKIEPRPELENQYCSITAVDDFERLRANQMRFANTIEPDTNLTKNPGSATEDGTEWTNETNVFTSNDARADYAGTGQADLRVTNFSFSAIPSDAIIRGIKVSVEGFGDNAAAAERSIDLELTKDGTTRVGGDLRTIALNQATDTTQTTGSEDDLWGSTWTVAEIQSANFGVIIEKATATNNGIHLDHVTIQVFFGIPSDNIMADILDAYGFPNKRILDSSGVQLIVDMDTGLKAIDDDVLTALMRLQDEEDGFIYIDGEGYIHLESRTHRAGVPHTVSQDTIREAFDAAAPTGGIFNRMDWIDSLEMVENEVDVQFVEAVQTSAAQVWSHPQAGTSPPSTLSIPGGDTIENIMAEIDDEDAADNYILPATSQGPLNAGSAVETGAEWTGESNVFLSDDNRAVYAGTLQEDLRVTNFPTFNIPASATILGIVVFIEGQGAGGTVAERTIDLDLTKDGAARVGTTKTDVVTQGVDAIDQIPATRTDLWGTTWTPAEINATTFGVIIQKNTAVNNSISIDHVRIQVYYKDNLHGNSAADGTGTDKSAALDIEFTNEDKFAGKHKQMKITNTDAGTVFITKFDMDADSRDLGDLAHSERIDQTSIDENGERRKEIPCLFIHRDADARLLATSRRDRKKDGKNELRLTFFPQNQSTLNMLTQRVLSDRVTVDYTDFGVNADYFLEGEEWIWSLGGKRIEVVWQLREV